VGGVYVNNHQYIRIIDICFFVYAQKCSYIVASSLVCFHLQEKMVHRYGQMVLHYKHQSSTIIHLTFYRVDSKGRAFPTSNVCPSCVYYVSCPPLPSVPPSLAYAKYYNEAKS